MYQVYPSKKGVDVLVCFPVAQFGSIFLFRDKLTEALLKVGNIQVHKVQGHPLPPDSHFLFFSENHAAPVKEFLQKKYPGFVSRLLNTAEWVSFQDKKRLAGKMIDIEIATSHDFPCIVVTSHIHTEKTISDLIQETAEGLGINLARNMRLGFIKDVVTSNESFSL